MVQRLLRRESTHSISTWTFLQQVHATYRVALILNLVRSDSTWIALMAQNIVVQVFLIVNLADNLRETLGCKHPIAFTSLERADAKTLAQEELLTKGS